MRIVIPGGTGQLGSIVARWLIAQGHHVDIIGRRAANPALRWDGEHDGPWMDAIDGADAVVNLAGRSVNCRYTWHNLNEMMRSRVLSTQAVGRAIAKAHKPPAVWLQASTASIYAHNQGTPHSEAHGVLGGTEADVPDYWAYSVHIARAWELALHAAPTPHTRKVALRTGFTMSPDADGIFDVLMWLVNHGLGGPMHGGEQFVSWIWGQDFARAIEHLIGDDSLSGPVNLTAPRAVRQRDLMAHLCQRTGTSVALPIAPWMSKLGAIYLQTDTELMLKSRRVAPTKLLNAGFTFEAPTWEHATAKLLPAWRERAA